MNNSKKKYTTTTILKKIFDVLTYNHELSTLIEGVDDILKTIQLRKTVFKPDVWDHELHDIWGIIVMIYGEYGTSPGSGWITEYTRDYFDLYEDLAEIQKDLLDSLEMEEDNE